MTSDPETATTPAEAPPKASHRKRNILIVAAILVIVVDVVALILFPPVNKEDPSAPYNWPADAIKQNIEPLVPMSSGIPRRRRPTRTT